MGFYWNIYLTLLGLIFLTGRILSPCESYSIHPMYIHDGIRIPERVICRPNAVVRTNGDSFVNNLDTHTTQSSVSKNAKLWTWIKGSSDKKDIENTWQTAKLKPFSMPPLRWNPADFETVFTPEVVFYHFSKHHKGYVVKLNEIAANDDRYSTLTLEVIQDPDKRPDFVSDDFVRQAAASYNHALYWESVRPPPKDSSSQKPWTKLMEAITKSFGSMDNFLAQWKDAFMKGRGSYWVFLTASNIVKDSLKIITTDAFDSPITMGENSYPLATIDGWEHSWYITYRNSKGEYFDEIMDKYFDWNEISRKFYNHIGAKCPE